jgi:uncharacterized membrane-anchored protein
METPKVETPKEDCKPLFKSKTVWLSVIVAVAGFFPPAQAILVAQPEIASLVVGGIFGAVRLITKGKVSVK